MLRSATSYRASRPVTIFSSLGGEKSPFHPLDASSETPEVKMYVCGLTPQDHPHIGHGLMAMRFDLIRRYLTYRNLNVTFIQNVTDVEDKIIDKSLATGEDPMAMTERFTKEFYEALAALEVQPVTKLPKVTEYMNEIITFVQGLVERGFAYATEEGNVYFKVKKSEEYGKLSNQNVDMLYESVRKELDKQKESPLDFALWKRDESTALSKPSPWGVGRPGWHIECSVMIYETLGEQIDIHGGGLDLKFPHHENEIAQSEAFTGKKMANVWMHSGLLNINGQKMSKSLNNFITLRDGIARYGANLLRFVVSRHHYRSSIDLTAKLFSDNVNSLLDFHRLFHRLGLESSSAAETDISSSEAISLLSKFEEAMDNDFNSSEAFVLLEQARNQLVAKLDSGSVPTGQAKGMGALLRELGQTLGVFYAPLVTVENEGLAFVGGREGAEPLSREEVQSLLTARTEARASKNFSKADEIRGRLAKGGVEILDTKAGTSWRYLTVAAA